jgi:transposase
MSRKSGSSAKQSGSTPKKSYPPEVREKAVKLITELVYSVSEVAQQLGCSTASVHRWQSAATPLDPAVSLRMQLGEDEARRLRKEVQRLKMEIDILKKATAYFAKDTLSMRLQRSTPGSTSIVRVGRSS